MRPRPPLRASLLVACLLSAGCVKKSTHEVVLTDLARADARIETLESELVEAREDVRELEEEIAALTRERNDLEERLATESSRFQEAVDELYRVEGLLTERGAEYQQLERRLRALRDVEREVRERNAIYEDVIGRFRSLMDGGQLSVAIARGRLVILLPQDVLFASGSATLGREGRAVITEVAQVLAEFPDRRFQVEGHTDDVPISTERFPSNWELSSARALAVVRLLVDGGLAPENVSGAAFGEYQPVASNDDREGRARNRRIEIVMLPNLDVIADTPLPGGDPR